MWSWCPWRAPGSSFPLGVTSVTCNATDAAGNAATPETFTVTVADTTPPVIAINGAPAALSRSASFDFTTSEGTTTCQLDGGGFSGCGSPVVFSGLVDGSHTFDVKATDAAGNTATAARTWKIDATVPVLSLPPTRIGEADGPGGAIASFTVSASDAGGALLLSAITCSSGSGQLYPIGTTIVTCRVSDAAGNFATGSFDVVIQDTTAPAINAPNVSFPATNADGARKSDPAVAAYLAGVSASDLVSTPTLTNDMPNVLPIGLTTVVFTATDAAGNVAKKSVIATVLPRGQKVPPPDRMPPGDVLGAKAKAGDRSVTLSWKPLAKDVARVVVTESVVGEPGAGRQIYNAAGTTVTAKGLVNGTPYRFLILAYGAAGNRSRGLIRVATPKAEALTSPKQAQRVTKPPLLRWAPVSVAAYFNVQLWRGSVKVLSAWPTATRYQLTAKWTYSGKTRKLAPGLYTWSVWPGLGPRAADKYGSLLGSRTFTYVAPPKSKPKK
jgi:HYR domain